MKLKHTPKRNHVRDFSFNKFFNPDKSPRTQGHYDKERNRFVFEYYPKHAREHNYPTRLAWDTLRRGTYVRAQHGNLK